MNLNALYEDAGEGRPTLVGCREHRIGSPTYHKSDELRDKIEDELGIPPEMMLNVSAYIEVYWFSDDTVLVRICKTPPEWGTLFVAIKGGQAYVRPESFINRYRKAIPVSGRERAALWGSKMDVDHSHVDSIARTAIMELWDEGVLGTRLRSVVQG